MGMQDSQRTGNSKLFINIEDVRKNSLDTHVYPSQQAAYIHFLLPIRSCHRVGVQISIIPFSLRGFQGQTFHFAQGAFTRCCDQIRDGDIILPISDVAEAIYKTSVPWHKWNLRAPGFWSELHPTSRPYSRVDICMDSASKRLELLMTQTKALELAASTHNLLFIDESDVQPSTTSSYSHTRASSRDTSDLASSEIQHPLKRKRKDEPSLSVEPVTATANALLEQLSSTSVPDDEVSSYIALTNIRNQPIAPRGENVSRAWAMCVNFARRSSQKIKYGRFLRFLSLCFFLIWEKYSDKQGKSAAREVNAKMREAGFSGHSRGLKTMRDETTLINRMVASIQEACGSKQAGTLYHVVFEPSNYQLIRTINRLGNEKKSSILEYMCQNVQLESLSSYHTSTTCVQSIIQQYLPNLSTDAISKAIGYQPIGKTRLMDIEGPTRSQNSVYGANSQCLEDSRPFALRNGPTTDGDTLFGGFKPHMLDADSTGGITCELDMLQSDGSPSTLFPTDMDGLEFGFPFDMDMDMGDMGGDMNGLTEAEHIGFIPS